MKVRQNVFDAYWKFAAERQEIFFKRFLNTPKPWTNDKILSSFKFCNTYRASDRVSQYLIKNVIYSGAYNEEDTIFRILLFKIFNKIETWELLEKTLDKISVESFNFNQYSKILGDSKIQGNVIYTNAYMSCANKAYGYSKKHDNHLALLSQMFFKDRIDKKIINARSMKEIFLLLASYPLIGNFMSYQLTTDLNYSDIINFSEQSFTVVGPGSERGIRKCFEDTNGKTGEYIIQWMCENQEIEFNRLGIEFKNLWGRPLQYIDCQGLFCETDKYSREAFPDLRSNRKRIKARFQETERNIDFFYPPKWGINDKVNETISKRPPLKEEPIGRQLSISF